MQAGDIRPGDANLEKTLEAVRNTPGEARKFAADPEAYLHSKGVSTNGLRIGVSHGELSDTQLDSVAGGQALSTPTLCVSVGIIICGSIGE